MGFFSWKCAVSGESLANKYSGQPREKTQCYLVTPDKTYYENSYEGYGVFEDVDVYELIGEGDRDKGIDDYFSSNRTPKFEVKIVLKEHYYGQTYEKLPKSEECEFQGFFY